MLNGLPMGTISFSSSQLKDEAAQRHKKDFKSKWKDWILDSNFAYLTVIYDHGVEAEVE